MSLCAIRDTADFCEQKKYRKMILTGTVVEVYEMDSAPYQMFNRKPEKEDTLEWLEQWETEIKQRSLWDKLRDAKSVHEKNRLVHEHNVRQQANITRTRNMVRRLALANFDNGSKFVTFTFAENITDVKEANKHWDRFIKKMRYRYGSFKYMAVIEFQKRGAVHYHCIWDLEYIPKAKISELWGNGFIKINNIEHVDNVGAYIVKYMTKDLIDERFKAQKAYQCSKGLTRPVVVRGDLLEEMWNLYDLDHKKAVFESSYTSEHHGKILYKEYNLLRV